MSSTVEFAVCGALIDAETVTTGRPPPVVTTSLRHPACDGCFPDLTVPSTASGTTTLHRAPASRWSFLEVARRPGSCSAERPRGLDQSASGGFHTVTR